MLFIFRNCVKNVRFFKKNRDKKPLQNWEIPVDANYRLINNGDSIQFVSADQSIILYFSTLTIVNNSLLPGDVLTKTRPSVTHSDNGWQFKGTKSGGKEMLVCLFSFKNESDEALVRDLFSNIVYVGK